MNEIIQIEPNLTLSRADQLFQIHFKKEECACPCGCGMGFEHVEPEAKLGLWFIRVSLNTPMYLTSVCRCAEYNKKIGGSELSEHQYGRAFDVSCKDSWYRAKLLSVLLGYPHLFKRIGVYKDEKIIHMSLGPELAEQIVFVR
jgi:hypothetical protein